MIDVALTPAEVRPADVAVVIDVLRASSTVSQALSAGYERVLCAESIGCALGLRGPARVLAGERRCVKPPGFDQGNSPLEAIDRRGDELVLATTNGAPAIVAAAAHTPRVLIGCLLNLEAVLKVLRDQQARTDPDVLLVCAGTDGAAALEDVYTAGLLVARLHGTPTDAALIADSVGRSFPTPLEALAASTDARVLRAEGLSGDIAHCARVSVLDLVPEVVAAERGVATLVRASEAAGGSLQPAAVDAGDTVKT